MSEPAAAEEETRAGRRGLLGLVSQLPGLVSRLIREELAAAQAELIEKVKAAGLGAGLVAAAAVFGLFALGAFITTAILGLATVLAPWLSALIVGVTLVAIAAVLALIGLRRLKAGIPPLPVNAIESVKADIRTVKGTR